ncbi:MAG TPA: TolC family protein [Ignavibacteriaceae bacterium]|jgi:outer membrane protein|nr:TolC family protein [Ignavibacteriaceae bacterium]
MKAKLKYLLFTLLVLFSSSYSQTKTFTLDEAIKTALNNNSDVKIAEMNVKKASAAVHEAFGYALPSLDLTAGFTHFLEKPKTPFPDFEALLGNATYSILFDENVIPRDDNKFKSVGYSLQSFALANNYETNLQLTQILFSSAVFRGIGASQIYLDLSKAQLKNTISATVLNVEKAFYGVQLTKEVYLITKASFENAQENYKNVSALYGQGLVSEFDNLQAEVQVENIRPTLLDMENRLKDAADGLKILLGLNPENEIDVEGEIAYQPMPIPETQDVVDEVLKSNLSLQTLSLKAQVDDAFIDLDRAEYWPNIAAFGNYSYAGSGEKWDFQNYSSLMVGVNFSINLWKGQRTAHRVEQSTLTYQQTEEQVSQLKDYLTAQVKSKINELHRVQTVVETQDKNVSLAERAYQISTVRYKEGTSSQLEVQNADIALRQARLNRLQTVYSYLITRYELEQMIGKVAPEYYSLFDSLND